MRNRGLMSLFAAGMFLPLVSFAQDASIPKPVIDSIAKDLATLQATVVEGQARLNAAQASSATGWNIDSVKATASKPALRLGATETANQLSTATPGEKFKVLDKTGDWYAVKLARPVEGYTAAWVKASDVVPYVEIQPKAETIAEDLFRKLTEQASKIKDSYRNNPYVSVTGFTVNVGISPSVGVNFEFKK